MLVKQINTDFLWAILPVHDPSDTVPQENSAVGQMVSRNPSVCGGDTWLGSSQSAKEEPQPRGVLEGGARHVGESADRYEPAFLSHWEEEGGTTLRGGLATIYVKSRHSEFPGLRVNFRSSVSSLLMNRNSILFLLSFWPFFLVRGQQSYSLSPFSLLLTLITCQLPASQIEIFLESVCRPQQSVCVYWDSTSFSTPHLCYNRIFYLL